MLVRTLIAAAALSGLAAGSAIAATPARPQAACPKNGANAKVRRPVPACAGCNETAPSPGTRNSERGDPVPFHCYRSFILAGMAQ